MPKTGSQITICDLPVRYDTYEGCSHACRYCFVNRKRDISNIGNGEGIESLRNFINGKRSSYLTWLDWNIPLHFGGMSDPFQPIEREKKRTLSALQLLRETQYPFVISTKNKMIAEEPYLSIIRDCNAVIQISAACPEYDTIEKGASTFAERIEAIRLISPYRRVIVRVQPYLPEKQQSIFRALNTFAASGAYGITVEGMKYIKAKHGTIKVGGDNCYPSDLLQEHYAKIKARSHELGMRFYCAENRLRFMGDDLCCCGVDGLGWRVNTGNLVHLIYDRENAFFSEAQKAYKLCNLLALIKQATIPHIYGHTITFEQFMRDSLKVRSEIIQIIPDNKIKKTK